MTENEIAKQVTDVTFLILLKHGFKRVVNGLLGSKKNLVAS